MELLETYVLHVEFCIQNKICLFKMATESIKNKCISCMYIICSERDTGTTAR